MTRYWFKPRRYGYGAAPATWEGWLVTALAAALVVCSIVMMNLWIDRASFSAWIVWAVLMTGLVFCFVQFCRRRTDGEWQWRWGKNSASTDA